MGTIVWVEGIIGAGKTTLTRELSLALGLRELLEPVSTNPFLEKFYQDQKRWAFPMQMFMLVHRAAMHKLAAAEASIGPGVILDRGIPGDMVFAEMHHQSGNIHDLEWMTYLKTYRELMTNVQELPRLLIYLDVEPEVAMFRIQERARGAELHGLDLDYLRRLRDGYEEMFRQTSANRNAWGRGARTLRVAWNSDSFDAGGVIKDVLSRLT